MRPNLPDYLKRIGLDLQPRPDLETLKALHRAHALSIPYENLDVYLQRPVDQDIVRIFNKIVHEGRGGWCYEMNGLFGWALREIGFDVTRHTGGVFRAEQGDDAFGNHLVHTVDLEDATWVVDVGIGDFIKEPVMLQDGHVADGGNAYRLEALSDGSWRFHNREGGMPPSFDFRHEPADEDRLEGSCQILQQDPESMFRQNLICLQMSDTGLKALVGRTWRDSDAGIENHIVESEDELAHCITEGLGIAPPPLDGLWDKVVARHEALFGEPG